MNTTVFDMSVPGARVSLDLRVGHLSTLAFTVAGRELEPLHRAPWLAEPKALDDEKLAPVERYLSGDFLCAPFATNDIDGGPPHGWSANSPWEAVSQAQADGELTATFRLARKIHGAVIEKELCLHNAVPLLYQTHRFIGGTGALPVAHHTMTRLRSGGQLWFSPKRYALTPERPLEPNHHRLCYPAQSADLSAFPGIHGANIDLHVYPSATGNEDFVILVEQDYQRLGWTAVLRKAEKDIVFVLKDPRELPVTMLWFSNGGRDYSPWNGRHTGVLGIEDGRSAGVAGHKASINTNPLNRDGVPTALELAKNGVRLIRQIIGAVPQPDGWHSVIDITAKDSTLRLIEASGKYIELPFDTGFFARQER